MVSVLLCVYDEKIEYVRSAIESILTQTFSDLELIIVLDKPDRHDLRELVYSYCLIDIRVKVVCNEENLGLVKSLNRALKLAKGTYIARMDADDISLPERIEKEVQAVEDDGYDLVGIRVKYIDQNGNISQDSGSRWLSESQILDYLTYSNCIPHPTWLAKRTTFESLNGYRNIPVAEDYDFLLRAIKKDMRIALIDDIGLYYRTNPNGISQSNKFKQYLVNDFLAKNFRHKINTSEKSVEKMLIADCTNQNLEAFEEAERLLNVAKKRKTERKYLQFVVLLMKSIIKSKYLFRLMLRNKKLKKILKQ